MGTCSVAISYVAAWFGGGTKCMGTGTLRLDFGVCRPMIFSKSKMEFYVRFSSGRNVQEEVTIGGYELPTLTGARKNPRLLGADSAYSNKL